MVCGKLSLEDGVLDPKIFEIEGRLLLAVGFGLQSGFPGTCGVIVRLDPTHDIIDLQVQTPARLTDLLVQLGKTWMV
jgi:hypothetical protein